MAEPNKGALCACNSGILDIECCSGASKPKALTPPDDRTMLQSIFEAVSKIDALADKVNGLETHIVQQDKIIDELKASSSKGSSSSECSGTVKTKTRPSKPK